MLTFEDVVNAPVVKLKQAADDWSEMAAKLKKLATEARDGMKAKTDKAQWQGVNSDVTRPFIAKTAKEFEDAEAQAKGIHLLLADAHTSFTAARDSLVRIRDEEGPAAGVHVDANGRVRPKHDLTKDVAARRDPDYPDYAADVRKQQEAVASWQARIDRIVEDCADADDSLRRALAANVKDAHDFTAPTYKSLDEEQVARAAELLKKVTGEGGTARNVAELKELEELLDDNRNDPEFATGFYRWVGPAATLDAFAEMSLNSTSLGPAGQDRVDMVRNIQSDMGAMLGLATQRSTPNHLDAVWTDGLLRAGRKPLDVQGVGFSEIYGYQALSGLLREGAYDKDFLVSVGRDMVAMDREDPGRWSHALPMNMDQRINLDETGGKGFNPLTGLMEAMANNPAASTAFFDENLRSDTNKDGIVTLADEELTGKDAKSVVDHVLDKKPTDDYYDTVVGGEPTPGQSAMGNALEAAVTGRVPGGDDAKPVEHTKAMASVMEKVVEKIGTSPGLAVDDGPLVGLAPNLGNMAAEYMPDLQAAAENGADQAMPFGEMANFKKNDMAFFLGAVGQDPDAYGAITNAQQAYTTMLVADVFQHPERHGDPSDALENAVHPGGEIAGIMTEARAQAVHEAKAHEAEEYNKSTEENAKWTNRIIDMVGGKYIDMVPVGGDIFNWIKEDVTESAVESAKQDKSEEARHETARDYTFSEEAAKNSAISAVKAAARGTSLTPEQIEEYQGVASVSAGTAHSVGRDLISSTKG
ncbi:hypothetical protein GCM10010497_00540 [Streptomyces cinereoruber]|uniref:DUF6571 domain-containing protein n=1 Tax=Streptomyces cinereoruber TaxID=67260 RepID=A0AAV4K8L3_9ACTN|nr:DUF6571 family protein [Streptomyces cinereoruber]MBB4158497.1 hypothetical protein [Streptomyces cinereoruber]MBY8814454.1 hypothetical protein [Streptomyces cinereoruber]NIH59158.1 hypothetical protein [Streptomyces cinereoruber]QEV34889.1 hypothetical protein CP977_24265 [Streptomyces cinereoruber]GGR03372.1 hypothetical protein GCM10010497_00540 [Streptomyces cinereoruber]